MEITYISTLKLHNHGHTFIHISYPLSPAWLCRLLLARIAWSAGYLRGTVAVADYGTVSVYGRAVGGLGDIGRCGTGVGLGDTDIGNQIQRRKQVGQLGMRDRYGCRYFPVCSLGDLVGAVCRGFGWRTVRWQGVG